MINDLKPYDLIKFEDGEFSLDVNVSPKEDTVWLTQAEMAMLFQKDRKTITSHIKNIFIANELSEKSVCSFFKHTASDGKTYTVKYYNLDMIISVGYRVNSKRGILFRKWATSVLKQYMMNGFSINEKRCLEFQENLVSLNNKVDLLFHQNNSALQRLDTLENPTNLFTDKLFYEGNIYDAYSYIKQLFQSAISSIILIDGYVNLTVLNMLVGIPIPIIIYTYPSSALANQDIDTFNRNHNLTVYRTNKIHDRFIIIDTAIYLCGSSIKDVGKIRFVLTKLTSFQVSDLLKNI